VLRPALVSVGTLLVVGVVGYAVVEMSLAPEPPLVSPLPYAAVRTAAPAPALAAAPTAPASGPGAATTASTPAVDPTWVAQMAVRTGIPEPAMRAYATAQLAAPEGCAVGWTTLAGIGWVESQNGTLGGRTLGEDGRSNPPILGPALDGHGVAAIRATARSSAWHGDPVWDHAVGPMQFLPSTWEQWGRDGDGDGVADPHDLDDAASTAMAYLCADGHDLTSGVGWADAVFGYNHAQSYVDSVRAAASTYADRAG
jgi:membrane-bound lytic murein transglycosylase B